jgi:hypothetical protein
MKSMPIRCAAAQGGVTSLMNSGPLSQQDAFRLPRYAMIRSSYRITRSDGSEKSTSLELLHLAVGKADVFM